MEVHPCQKCGACCAYFRVNFYWREAEPTDTQKAVPQGLWVEASDNLRCMKGTDQKHNPKCVALKGRIGKFVACSIYTHRSSTCKKFEASYENNTHQPRCDEARAKHGLRPLTKQDWFYQTNAQVSVPSQSKAQAPAEAPSQPQES
jgi:Fe-S-cluster containining protein